MRDVAAITALGLLAGACGDSAAPGATAGAAVRAHIEVLADDAMQGREAGTDGHRRAADYAAAQFAARGLDPLGDDGGYLQQIDFLETRLVPGSGSVVLHRDGVDVRLAAGDDYVQPGGFGEARESLTAPLVFAGFGIHAPEYGHDDFAGVDVAGRILVAFTGAPPQFDNDERAYYSSSTVKSEFAVERGAAGIVWIRTPIDAERLTWPRMLQSADSAGMRWMDEDGIPQEGFPELAGSAMLSDSGAARLFGMAGRDLGALFRRHLDGGTGSFDTGVAATITRESIQRRVTSPNVLALLPGGDPALRDEYVLFTAHLDHLGVAAGDEGDVIYNGAYDNAAGVATLLEVAGAMSRSSPRRSLVFAALTAEEKGLRGSDYLARNFPVPIDRLVAVINVDMPYLGYPIADVEGFGVEHSTLHDSLLEATTGLGLALTPDPRPELVRLIRSDQFSFVRQGVPGLNLKPGSMAADPAIDGAALRAAFLTDHYHHVSDDLALPFSEQGAARFVRLVADFGTIVANEDARPRWREGDFFGRRFGHDGPSQVPDLQP